MYWLLEARVGRLWRPEQEALEENKPGDGEQHDHGWIVSWA